MFPAYEYSWVVYQCFIHVSHSLRLSSWVLQPYGPQRHNCSSTWNRPRSRATSKSWSDLPPAINTAFGLFSSVDHSRADGIPESWNCINAVPVFDVINLLHYTSFGFCCQILWWNGAKNCDLRSAQPQSIDLQTIKYGQLLKMIVKNEKWNGHGVGRLGAGEVGGGATP